MDSLAESVTRKRDELAKLQQQAAERDARIAKLQAAEKAAEKTELYDEFFKQRPPEPELTEAQKKEKWDRVEAERSAMQQNAPCGFDAAKLFPEM